jgi:anion-transporting  ArsA/GET3 family ATPase
LPYRVGGKRGSRVFNVASRPFYQVADRILGSKFLQEIAEFFLNFQSMYEGFSTRAKAVEQLLHDRRTTFVVVTTLEAAPLHEAESFCDLLDAGRFHLGALVLNRTLPDSLLSADGARTASRFTDDAPALAAELAALAGAGANPGALGDEVRTSRVLRTVGESFQNFSLVAKREAELRAELTRRPEVVARIPSFDDEITDLSGLTRVGSYLFGDAQ